MNLSFSNVGALSWSGTVAVPDTNDPDKIAEEAYRIARHHLVSREVETSYDPSENDGLIQVGGGRTAGHFKVER